MKGSFLQENIMKYESLITSFVRTAIAQTDGAVDSSNFSVNNVGFKYRATKNIHTYFNEDEVTIDAYINVLYGYNVPQVACNIQEKVINAIRKNTPLKVNSVNINVSNVIFL